MWATLTDVSLHGCYVEMNSTFPVGTKVNLVLKSFGIRIQARGLVQATYPSMGMGISFSDIDPVEELQLRQLLAALVGRRIVSKSAAAALNSVKDALGMTDPRLADPRAVLDEIAAFFQKNPTLSRDDFYEIAKRVRRS